MSRETKDIELLSAYVDGELEAPDAARLAHRIAASENMARQAAKMAEMKSAVASLAHDVVVVTVREKRRSNGSLFGMALAACLGLAIITAAWFGFGSDKRDAVLQQATMQHDLWTTATAGIRAAPASAPPGLFAPEMTAAGLMLALVRKDIDIGGRPATQIGYVGRHGCRVSLFRVSGRPVINNDFELASSSTYQHAAWTDDIASYFLIARGMDEARFAAIAGILRSMSLDDGNRKLETIASLEATRRPCIG